MFHQRRYVFRQWTSAWPVQLCALLLLIFAFWLGTNSDSTHPLLKLTSKRTDRLTQLMDEQTSQYGPLKIGHSSSFEAAPPPEFDSSAPSYFLPNTAEPLTRKPHPPLPPPDDEEYIAFCLVVRNQSIDMPEFFVHHYHHHGIRRFYIYDDGTSPPLSHKPYIDSWGIPDEAINFTFIEPKSVKQRGRLQADKYMDCAKKGISDPSVIQDKRPSTCSHSLAIRSSNFPLSRHTSQLQMIASKMSAADSSD